MENLFYVAVFILLVVTCVFTIYNFGNGLRLSKDHEEVIHHLKQLKYVFTQLKNVLDGFETDAEKLKEEANQLELDRKELDDEKSRLQDQMDYVRTSQLELNMKETRLEELQQQFDEDVKKFIQDKNSFESVKQEFLESQLQVNETISELDSTTSNRYYAVCLCTRSNQSKFLKCFITDNTIEGEPSEEDLRELRSHVLSLSSDYVECEIIFFSRLKG